MKNSNFHLIVFILWYHIYKIKFWFLYVKIMYLYKYYTNIIKT